MRATYMQVVSVQHGTRNIGVVAPAAGDCEDSNAMCMWTGW